MNPKAIIACVLLLGLHTWPAAAQAPQPAKGHAPEDERISIRGNEFVIVPPERLRARGFDRPEIPREKNAFWIYLDAMTALKNVPPELQESFDAVLKSGVWPEGEPGQRLAAWLEENGPALDLARQAATMPDYAAAGFLYPGAPLTTTGILLPYLSLDRHLAKVLAIEAASLRAQGQSDAAMEDYLTMQRLGNHVASGGLLIEGLVGVAINSLAGQGIIRLAESGTVSPDMLKTAMAELEQAAGSQPDWQRMIDSERRFGEGVIDDAIDTPGGLWMMNTGFVFSPERYEPNGWSELARRLKRLYLPDRTIKKQLRRHYTELAEAGKPKADGTVVTIEEDRLFKELPVWNFPARLIVPSLSRVYEITLLSRSNHERANLAMAIAAYRAEQGTPPPSLATLTPKYVAKIPLDPATGYEFDYQVTSDDAKGYQGLDRVTMENAAELQKKRRAPAILSPRASRWRRYVQSVCDRYQFSEPQRTAAEAILRDMESRAGQYEQTQGAKLQELVNAGQSDELSRKVKPLDQLFNELKQRLEALPDAKQRAAASQPAEKKAE